MINSIKIEQDYDDKKITVEFTTMGWNLISGILYNVLTKTKPTEQQEEFVQVMKDEIHDLFEDFI